MSCFNCFVYNSFCSWAQKYKPHRRWFRYHHRDLPVHVKHAVLVEPLVVPSLWRVAAHSNLCALSSSLFLVSRTTRNTVINNCVVHDSKLKIY